MVCLCICLNVRLFCLCVLIAYFDCMFEEDKLKDIMNTKSLCVFHFSQGHRCAFR